MTIQGRGEPIEDRVRRPHPCLVSFLSSRNLCDTLSKGKRGGNSLPRDEADSFNDCRLDNLFPWEYTPCYSIRTLRMSIGPQIALTIDSVVSDSRISLDSTNKRREESRRNEELEISLSMSASEYFLRKRYLRNLPSGICTLQPDPIHALCHLIGHHLQQADC